MILFVKMQTKLKKSKNYFTVKRPNKVAENLSDNTKFDIKQKDEKKYDNNVAFALRPFGNNKFIFLYRCIL